MQQAGESSPACFYAKALMQWFIHEFLEAPASLETWQIAFSIPASLPDRYSLQQSSGLRTARPPRWSTWV